MVKKQLVGSTGIAIALMLISTLPARSQTSVSTECGTLLQTVNETTTNLASVFSSGAPDVELFSTASEMTAGAAENFAALELSDAQLMAYQGDFAELYTTLSDVTGRFAGALQAEDGEAIQTIYEEFRMAVRPEWELIQETQTYCQGQ